MLYDVILYYIIEVRAGRLCRHKRGPCLGNIIIVIIIISSSSSSSVVMSCIIAIIIIIIVIIALDE